MNVTYSCPNCGEATRASFGNDTERLVCPHCAQPIEVPPGVIVDGRVTRCLVCPSTELFVRKDFPQKLGVSLVVLGFIGSCIAWANYQVFWTFAILFGTALVDLGLYVLMGDSLMCYRCAAQYRGVEGMEAHGAFDLETREKYRQMSARMKETRAAPAAVQQH